MYSFLLIEGEIFGKINNRMNEFSSEEFTIMLCETEVIKK